MNQQEVLDLMRLSKSKQEWDLNCDKVKAAHNGSYPDYWYKEVVLSGLCDKTMGEGSSKINIIPIN